MSKKVRDRWQNIIMYVMSCLESQEDAGKEEAEIINNDMYNWLMTNFKITIKKKKQNPTIFDVMKNKHHE